MLPQNSRNIWSSLRLTTISLLAILLLPLSAQAEKITAVYDGEWNGLTIGRMTITVDEDATNYTYGATLQSEGLLKTFTGYRSENTSKGTLVNKPEAKPLPKTYFTEWWRKKKNEHQQITVTYNNGKAAEVANPPEKRPKRPVVTSEYKDNTLDPVSAAIFGRKRIREIAESGETLPKKVTMPVFDGRRRFDVELTVNGYKKMKYKGKEQQLLQITFFRTAVNGFTDKELARMKEQDPTIIFYLNSDYIPVLGSGSAPFGSANFILSSLSYQK